MTVSEFGDYVDLLTPNKERNASESFIVDKIGGKVGHQKNAFSRHCHSVRNEISHGPTKE